MRGVAWQGGVLITRACQASGAPEGRLDPRTVDPHSLTVPQQRFLAAARYEGHLVRVRARVRVNVRVRVRGRVRGRGRGRGRVRRAPCGRGLPLRDSGRAAAAAPG